MCSLVVQPSCSPVLRVAVVLAFILVPAFCGPIHQAARDGDLAKVKALLNDDPSLVFSRDDNGETPLHEAATGGHAEVVKFLLANKADVNAKDARQETPLHLAAEMDRREAAALLIARGADVNAMNESNSTPLDRADRAMVPFLRQHGAKKAAEVLLGERVSNNMISLPIKAVDGKTLQLWDRKNDKTYNINLTAGVVYCSDGKKVPDWRYLKAKMEEGVSVTVKLSSGTKSALVVWDEGPDLLSSMNSPFSGGASYYFPQMCK